MSDLQKKLFKKSSFGLELLSEDPTQQEAPEENQFEPSQDDLILEDFYNKMKNLAFPVNSVYTNPKSGVSFQTYYSPPIGANSPILICHHGAGSSSMTFCWLTRYLKREWAEQLENPGQPQIPGVFVFDARGHGNSSSPDPANYNLDALTEDFRFVLREFHSRHSPQNTLCLVGHSLGGSVLTNYVTTFPQDEYDIRGLVVIDITEETAIRALLSVSQFLSKRPKFFRAYAEAVLWHLLSHLLKNEESARVSVFDLLNKEDTGKLTWKADLAQMSNFWDSWFVNLSDNFIKCGAHSKHKIAKLLILSGNETLDKSLIIGQMQGKYQLIVFSNTANTGHFLQEDIPKQLGISIMEFVRRNDTRLMRQLDSTFEPRWGGKINQ